MTWYKDILYKIELFVHKKSNFWTLFDLYFHIAIYCFFSVCYIHCFFSLVELIFFSNCCFLLFVFQFFFDFLKGISLLFHPLFCVLSLSWTRWCDLFINAFFLIVWFIFISIMNNFYLATINLLNVLCNHAFSHSFIILRETLVIFEVC